MSRIDREGAIVMRRSSNVLFVKGSWMSPATHIVALGRSFARTIATSPRRSHIAVLGRTWMRSVPVASHRSRIIVVEAG